MKVQDSFSSSEIIDILNGAGVEDVQIVDDESSADSEVIRIQCDKGALNFRCYLWGSEPAFTGMHLGAFIFCVAPNPYQYVNEVNSKALTFNVFVAHDDEGEVSCDDDGDPLVVASTGIQFDGGVTVAHIARRIECWIEDVIESFGLVDEVDEMTDPDFEVNDGVRELSIAEQISWVLGIDSVPRTARQLATFLMKEKQEINSALYRSSNLFESDGSQPPRWTLRHDGG
jgi:hypothetical protein